MKMKKALSVMLAAAMTMTLLVGCGGNSGSDSGSDTGSSTESSKEESSGDVFKIGGIGPVTGGAAVYGEAVKNGSELAVKEINEAGGINGVQIEMRRPSTHTTR